MSQSALMFWLRRVLITMLTMSGLAYAEDSTIPKHTDYRDLARACPSTQIQSRFVGRGKTGDYRFHAIDLAAGDEVNRDIYEVEVGKFPQLAGGVATPRVLFEHFRTQLSTMLDPAISRFVAHGIDDEKRWSGKDPIGSLMVFEINVVSPLSLDPKAPVMHWEQGAVLLTEMGGNSKHGYWWRFATVNTPRAGDHPVSGTREFGIRRSGDKWIIYTRGLDRATSWLDAIAAERIVFKGADMLWRSMQARLIENIVANGGEAKKRASYSSRSNWQKEFVDTKIFSACNWGKGSLGTHLDARGLRSALAFAIERDQTGAAAALSVAALRAAITPAGTQAVISEIETVARQLRDAANPVAIDAIISSDFGRKLGLSYVRSAYDPTKLGYVDFRRDRGVQRHMIGAVIDTPIGTIGSHNITRELLSRENLNLNERELRAVLSAVTLSSPRATVESYIGSIVDEKGRDTIKEVMTTFSMIANGPRNPQILLEKAKTALLQEGVSRLNERIPMVQKVVDDFNRVTDTFNTPAFRDLERGNLSADSLIAGSNALRVVAGLFGQEQLAKNIDDTMRFVNAGMDVYKGVSLLAAGFSGGTFFAATSILGGIGGLNAFSGDGGEAAAIARGLGKLTELINRQFEKVNWKLDEIRLTLGKIERRLLELEGLQIATLTEVRATHELVTGLYYRIDRLQADVLVELGQSSLDDCWTQITYPRPEMRDFGRQEWLGCLRAFSRQALLSIPSTNPSGDADRWSQLIQLLTPQSVNDRAILWRHAALIADADWVILGDIGLKDLSEFEQRTKYLAGAHIATEASIGFSALIKRRGRGRIKPEELSYYIRNNRVEEMLARLDAVENFQRLLAGEKPAERIKKLLTYYENAQAPLVKSLQKARLDAIRSIVVPKLDQENLPYEGMLTECHTGAQITTLDGDWKKDLPVIAHTHGGFYLSYEGSSLVRRTVLQPLSVCRSSYNSTTYPVIFDERFYGYHVKVSSTYKSTLFGKSYLESSFEEENTYPDRDDGLAQVSSQINGQFASALRTKFAENGFVEKLEDEKILQISTSTIPEVQIRVLGATFLQLNDEKTKTNINRDGEPVDGTLALIRGHLALAFPVTYLSHDQLRAALEGGVSTRVGDLATIRETLGCALALQRNLYDVSPPENRTQDGNTYPTADIIEKNCGKNIRSDIFSEEKALSFDSHFGIKVKDVQKIVDETDWTMEIQYRTGAPSLAAAQLRAFIADGDKAWFYP